MIISCLCAVALITRSTHVVHPPSDGQLEKLGRARMAFNGQVIEGHREVDGYDEDHIYSMGPGEQKINGYYPFGRSDNRFLVYDLNGWRALQYQQIEGKHARRVWRVMLHKAKGKPKFTGTLARVLRRHRVEVTGRIPTSARKALNDTFRLAAYGYDGDGNLSAWTINEDGSLGPVYDYGELKDHSYFPIVPEESSALGLGSDGWPLGLKRRKER